MAINPIRMARSWWSAMGDAMLEDCETTGFHAANRAQWRADDRAAYCGRCGATAGQGAATESGCPHCRRQAIAWDGLWRLGVYDHPVSGWVKRMKFSSMWTWGPWFGEQLALSAGQSLKRERTIITAVPLHWRRRWGRGYDQAWLLAQAMSRASGVAGAQLLTRCKSTHSQSKLRSHRKRAENVRNAFAMKRIDLTGWTVWLIDDVKTTGSTLTQCTRLLKEAGAERVYIAVVAVADAKGADFERS